MSNMYLENKHLLLIDTPHLDDPYGKSENEINKTISENPNIKCLILLSSIHEKRINQSTGKLPEKLIKRFPIKNFWEDIVVRTHLDEDCRYIKWEKILEEKKNILLNFINDNESMKNHKKYFVIVIPYIIDEYYFGKSKRKGFGEDYEYNSTEFIKILNKIKNLSSSN